MSWKQALIKVARQNPEFRAEILAEIREAKRRENPMDKDPIKLHRRKQWEERKEQGQAGLAGKGRSGPMPSKKDKLTRPDRKQKHKRSPQDLD